MRIILILAWIGALFGAIASTVVLVAGVAGAGGAPGEAAAAGIACAVAIIPYVFARALEGVAK